MQPLEAEGHRQDHGCDGNTSPNRISEGAPERRLGEHRAPSALERRSGQNRKSSDAVTMNEKMTNGAETFGGGSLFLLLLLDLF